MDNSSEVTQLEAEAALIYSVLFLLVVILMLSGIFLGAVFKTMLTTLTGHLFIGLLSIMALVTVFEIYHIYKIKKCIDSGNIEEAKRLDSILYSLIAMVFSGLITGIILMFIGESLKNE